MPHVVEHLAALTAYRDRDLLDATLAGALKDLLRPQSVAVYRRVDDGDAPRWSTRARIAGADLVASADPPWQEPSALPALDAEPARLACLLRQEPLLLAGAPATSLFPLASEREAIGVLEVATAQPMDGEQLRLVGALLRVYRNMQGLLDYSERDTLTGLLNRKTFDEVFMRMAAAPPPPPAHALPVADGQRRAGAADGGTWLGVIDIDHFKRVNDSHGHLIGDEVLLLLSRLMRGSFRCQDCLYRFGGEEFVVLMRSDSAAHAALAFERLRANVERHVFPRVGHVTVSIGFTALRPSDTPSSAFERADRAVYHAKQNGRNQVAHHAALVAGGLLVESARDGDVELF